MQSFLFCISIVATCVASACFARDAIKKDFYGVSIDALILLSSIVSIFSSR